MFRLTTWELPVFAAIFTHHERHTKSALWTFVRLPLLYLFLAKKLVSVEIDTWRTLWFVLEKSKIDLKSIDTLMKGNVDRLPKADGADCLFFLNRCRLKSWSKKQVWKVKGCWSKMVERWSAFSLKRDWRKTLSLSLLSDLEALFERVSSLHKASFQKLNECHFTLNFGRSDLVEHDELAQFGARALILKKKRKRET